ncbi:MAG: LuxR C-terminal-related transcriptional regulator [Desulfobacterales bacterium]|jgi:DNA-binding CsgD family transcriptional regulator
MPRSPLSDPLARTVIDSLSAHIAILDADGVIIDVNRAWKAFAIANGADEDADFLGINYLTVCDAVSGPGASDARAVSGGIRKVAGGEQDSFLYDYPCHSPDGKHWYYMRAIRMAGEGPIRIVVSHEDITALKLTEEALRRSQQRLQSQKMSLQEANIALKVLLKQREEDREELERKVLVNIKELVLPYVEKMKKARLNPRDRTLVDIIDSHLRDVISPFLQKLSNMDILLTPQEIHVAGLVKDGLSSKEIADLLHISVATVQFHRKSLRTKLGLQNRRINLRTYLMSQS